MRLGTYVFIKYVASHRCNVLILHMGKKCSHCNSVYKYQNLARNKSYVDNLYFPEHFLVPIFLTGSILKQNP